ncbi:MAG: NUDIX hydrolase [Candidatus Odinarchaeota archaeon]
MTRRKYPSRPWVSAHAIIFNAENKILLTKRAAPPKKHYWFPPGGAINLGETVKEGLKREILEETAVKVKNLQFIDYIDGITRDDNNRIAFHFVVFMFSADYLEGDVKAMDDALAVRWLSIEEIKKGNVLITDELLTLLEKIER